VDPRTRRDRIERRNEGFKYQFTGIVDAYIAWQEAIGEEGLDAGPPSVPKESLQGVYKVQVFDVFCKHITLFSPRAF
jgi:hypothetical protein